MILNLFNPLNVLLIFLSSLSFALLFKYKKKFFFFFDNDYNKPQSFHKDPTLRFGGIIIFFFFLIYYFFLEKKNFINSITILSSLFFIIGVFDDLKFHIKSGVRLFLMFFLSSLFIYLLNIKIENTQFFFLN